MASPSETRLSVSFDVPEKERFTSYPKKLVNQASRKLGLKTSRVTVLTQNDLSLSSSVQNLTKYLAKRRFDITLVASQARTGYLVFSLEVLLKLLFITL